MCFFLKQEESLVVLRLMSRSASLNEIEQFVLLSLARLGTDAYGVTVREEIEARAQRPVSMAAVYAALDRLQRRGYVQVWLSEPIRERGGRARKHFRIRPDGERALADAREAMQRMWDGVELGSQ